MDGQVALPLGTIGGDTLEPFRATGHAGHGVGGELPDGVVAGGEGGPGGGPQAWGGVVLAGVEHRAVHQDGDVVPVPLLGGGRHRQDDDVGELLGDSEALRPDRGEPDGHLDRQGGPEAGRVDELARPAVDLDDLAGEQASHLGDVGGQVGPLHAPLAHGVAGGEAGAEVGPEATGGEVLDGGDGRRRDDRVAHGGDGDAGGQADVGHGLGDAGEGHPDVAVEGRRVEHEHPLVAELGGGAGVVDDVAAGRRRDRDGGSGRHGVVLRVRRRRARRSAGRGRRGSPGRWWRRRARRGGAPGRARGTAAGSWRGRGW